MPNSNATDSPYKNDSITPITLEDSIRKRPAMYFGATGSKGIINLIDYLLKDFFKLCSANDFVFIISLHRDNSLSIEVSSENNLVPFLQSLNPIINKIDYYSTRFAIAASKTFKISNDKIEIIYINGQEQFSSYHNSSDCQTNLIINLEPDETVFGATNIDYIALNQKLILIPITNRQTEIITKDERGKYLRQNYYHFPQGSFYIFDSVINSLNGKPDFQLKFEGSLGEHQYQIALADKYWGGSITSFANYIQTTCNGSLVDGVIEGIIIASKKYIKANRLEHHKITKKKIMENFIIVCSVNGPDFDYEGSFRQKLSSNIVQSQSKELVRNWIYNYLASDENVWCSFLLHFKEHFLFPSER